MSACGFCGGPKMLLGSLGLMKHYRCRNCGMPTCRMGRPRVKRKTPEQVNEEKLAEGWITKGATSVQAV